MERVVPPSGFSVGGYNIAPGTVVSVPYYLAHRDHTVWGDDASVFRPERWLNQDPTTSKKMERNFLAVSFPKQLLFQRG